MPDNDKYKVKPGSVWWLAVTGGPVLREAGGFQHARSLLREEGEYEVEAVRSGLWTAGRFTFGTTDEMTKEGYERAD